MTWQDIPQPDTQDSPGIGHVNVRSQKEEAAEIAKSRKKALQFIVAREFMGYHEEKIPVIEDDASRFIAGAGSFDSAKTENSQIVLSKAIQEYGRLMEIMTYHRKQFFSIVEWKSR